jgi:diketogulonate reductase-like aldo/keto reductase
MGVDCLDLLQFHWWDYLNPSYLDALQHLSEMQREGKIKLLGLTNFDTAHLRIIVKAGIKIHTNQVCYSLLDGRAGEEMAKFCVENDIKLLCFGTIAGGLLTEKYLRKPEPSLSSWSTMKYKRYILLLLLPLHAPANALFACHTSYIDVWGGWDLFQELLLTLEKVAKKHAVSIPNVAARYVLQQPAVAAVLIGARLTESEHIADTLKVSSAVPILHTQLYSTLRYIHLPCTLYSTLLYSTLLYSTLLYNTLLYSTPPPLHTQLNSTLSQHSCLLYTLHTLPICHITLLHQAVQLQARCRGHAGD